MRHQPTTATADWLKRAALATDVQWQASSAAARQCNERTQPRQRSDSGELVRTSRAVHQNGHQPAEVRAGLEFKGYKGLRNHRFGVYGLGFGI